MRSAIRNVWQSRSPRERLVIAALAALIATILYSWLLLTANQARLRLDRSLSQLRMEAARLDKDASEIARLRAMQAPAPRTTGTQADLRLLVQNQIEAAGLARSLARVDMPDPNQARVVFGAVPFADWLAWVEQMRSQQVRLDTTRIEALSTSGLVSVTATHVRPRP